ncbi:MAG: hypothetical protein AB7S75_14780 [Desulfococcaceae bacterium]
MKMKKTGMTVMVVFAVLALCAASFAAEVEITPYIWFPGVDGDITINGQDADFDASAGDVFDTADVCGSLLGVVQFNRFLIWGQVDFFSWDTDELDMEDRPQGGSLEMEMLLGEVAAGFQVDGWMEGMTFDILGGVRFLSMENDLEVYGEGTYSKDYDLVDPILVIRPSIPLFPSTIRGLRFNPTFAVGGGGDSELVYEFFPQIQYQFTENFAARMGYRTIGYDFEGENNDDNELNIRMSGMIFGLGLMF